VVGIEVEDLRVREPRAARPLFLVEPAAELEDRLGIVRRQLRETVVELVHEAPLLHELGDLGLLHGVLAVARSTTV